jgi:molybdate transport system substrate-binding protein
LVWTNDKFESKKKWHEARMTAIGQLKSPLIGGGIALAFVALMTGRALSADLVVPSAAAVRAALASLPDRFAAASGHHLRFVFSTAGGTLARVASGEPFDLAIAPPAQIAELTKRGFLIEGKGGPLGATKLGVAVKRGGSKPGLETPDDFKAALLKAPSIGLADPSTGATTGIYFAKLLTDLGITDAIKAKIKVYPDGNGAMEALARGEVAIAAGQISEIMPVAGVDLAGPLPDAIQLKTVYAVGVSAKSANPEVAAELLAAMSSPETKAALKASGFDVP